MSGVDGELVLVRGVDAEDDERTTCGPRQRPPAAGGEPY